MPAVLDGVEPVRSVRTPAALEYEFTAGGRHEPLPPGHPAEEDHRRAGAPAAKVYVPSRGADPELGVPTSEQVEPPHVGTLTSFCVVNVAFYGQGMEIPYTSGLILLDGADLPIMHLIQECPVEDVHIGMRARGGVGRRRRPQADARDRSGTSDRTESPTSTVVQPGQGVTW